MSNGYGAYAYGGTAAQGPPVPAMLPDGDPPPAQLTSADPGNGNPGKPWLSVDSLGNLYVYGNQVTGGVALSPSGDLTGATDTAALAALPAYATLGPGTFNVNATITVPANGLWRGAHAGNAGTILTPTAVFTGTTVLELSSGFSMQDISINGAGGAAGLNGIHGNGVTSFRPLRVMIQNMTNNGCSFTQVTDSTMIDVDCRFCSGVGWTMSQMANTRLIGCQAEHNIGAGFSYTQSSSGTGSGGAVFIGCTSDRNGTSGFSLSGTGNAPVTLAGCASRRDNSTLAANHGGLVCNAASYPVQLGDFMVFPGVDDGGTGNASPASGLVLRNTSTFVQVNGAYLHAITTAYDTDGTSTVSLRNVALRTGSTAAPGAISVQADTA